MKIKLDGEERICKTVLTMKPQHVTTLCALAGLIWAGTVRAEEVPQAGSTPPEGTPQTNEVVRVTAAPLPKYRVAENDSGSLIPMPPEKVPFTVDTLTEDFIRERNATDLDGLLALQPGIYQGGKTIMSRSSGTYTIRGFGGSEVLFNGVPLPMGAGSFLDPSLLERVDIVKGPVGGAYGGQSNDSDTRGAGGSILLTPKRASFVEDFYDFMVKGSYSKASGSRLKFTADVNKVLADEGFAVRVPLAYEWREPGWAPSGAGYGNVYSVAPSMAFRLTERLEMGLDLFYQYSNQPAYQGIRTLYGKPIMTGWDDTYTRPGDRMRFQTHGGTLRFDGEVTDWLTLRTRVSFLQNESRWSYRGPNSSANFNPANPATWYEPSEGDRLWRTFYAGQDAIFKWETGDVKHTLLTGVNFMRKEAQGWSYFTSGRSAVKSYSSGAQIKTGVLGQYVGEYRGLSLLAGVRGDWHDSINHETKWTVSPRLGVSYDILEEGKAILFANVSFTDTPNFNYEKNPGEGATGKKYLDNTWHAVQKEAGLRVNPFGSLWLAGTVFRIDQSNAPIQESTGSSYYVSDGKTYSRGVEFSATGNITDRWSIYFAYTYIDYYDKTNGLRFDRFPPHALSLWTSYKIEWLNDAVLGFGGRWRDDWEMTFRGTRAGSEYVAKSLLTFDASLDFPLYDNFTLGFAIRNIFDTRGIESARNLQAFANDGRTFELSLRWRF